MKEMLSLRRVRKVIPVFLAADDKYVKFMMVTIRSIIANTTKNHQYKIYILHTDISAENQTMVKRMETSNCQMAFVDVTNELKKIEKKISLRDYYTATTYYRVFIADMFPEYDKVLYVDSDTVIREDIANLYQYELGKNYIGAVRDQLVVQTDIYGDICDKCNMNRKSFYYHFKDKYDLVNWIFDTEFIAVANTKNYEDAWDALSTMSNFFYANRNFYRKALCIKGQNSFSDHFKELILPVISDRIQSVSDEEIMNFQVTFIADAIVIAIQRWLVEYGTIEPEEFIRQIKLSIRYIVVKYSDMKN